MERYEVRVSTQAREDILSYTEYIRDELLNRQAAEKFVRDMWTAIKSLDHMPKRCPCTEEEPWHSLEVRKLIVRGYYIYYWIDEEAHTVTATGVVYGRMDQVKQLARMDFDLEV